MDVFEVMFEKTIDGKMIAGKPNNIPLESANSVFSKLNELNNNKQNKPQ